jgi:hypothetical protein
MFLQTLIINTPVHERDFISVEIPDQHLIEDGKIKHFWHLTTKEEKITGNKLPDPSRSERILWISYFINNFISLRVKHFEKKVNNQIRHHIWFEEGRFCIVININNPTKYLLTTSFYVTRKKKKSLQKDYEKYVKTGKCVE